MEGDKFPEPLGVNFRKKFILQADYRHVLMDTNSERIPGRPESEFTPLKGVLKRVPCC